MIDVENTLRTFGSARLRRLRNPLNDVLMPELAEVEYYRRQWLPCIGQKVVRVQIHAEKRVFREVNDASLIMRLEGTKLTHSEGHGKQMIFRFDDQHWLGVHLGMTGKTTLAESDYERAKHDHLVLAMSSGDYLVFSDSRMFGRIRYEVNDGPASWWRDLPPHILSDEFTAHRMEAFLTRRAKAPIKAVLLMQECFPGIGNWMADEVLWRARIRPSTRAVEIGARKRIQLYDTLVEVCEDAMRVIAPDWSTPPDGWLFNHRWKDGGVCPRTGGDLVRESIGGRTTCWSPKWQR